MLLLLLLLFQGDTERVNTFDFLFRQSQLYLSELLAFRKEIQGSARSEELDFLIGVERAESIWLLCHYLYAFPHDCVATQLMMWYHHHVGHVTPEKQRDASTFWEDMKRCVS